MPSRLPIGEVGSDSEEQQLDITGQHELEGTGVTTSAEDVHIARKVITQLPREYTFKRQQSELRERLFEVSDEVGKGRASGNAETSEGGITVAPTTNDTVRTDDIWTPAADDDDEDAAINLSTTEIERPDLKTLGNVDDLDDEHAEEAIDVADLQQDYQDRWILNLSMHFRDKSNREKFFITFAQHPNFWRRMTITLDYRDAPDGSLEAELRDLPFQRDKSYRIFEALRESLAEVKFYDTVTNLKLVTDPADLQLHVHVREDTNEIIEYPDVTTMELITCPLFAERTLTLDSHLSGFVYKVVHNGRVYIKKEIPGIDTVDEFIYEVNALNALQDCRGVMPLAGLVTNNQGTEVKGLLVEYAAKGALVDVLYDWEEDALPWHLRLKWAQQIIQGLSAIHEAGFVQGDFTLSNIVIDDDDDAHIIDINRRGCPVGWEPPELSTLIRHGHRVSMYIGVKTDLYQLGMVLWALAELNDEPERCDRPLHELAAAVPAFYKTIVALCLCELPQKRPNATLLSRMFNEGYNIWLSAANDEQRLMIPPVQLDNPVWRRSAGDIQDIEGGYSSYFNRHDSPDRGRTLDRQALWRLPTPSGSDALDEGDSSAIDDDEENGLEEEIVHRTHSTMAAAPPLWHLPRHEDSGFDEPGLRSAIEGMSFDKGAITGTAPDISTVKNHQHFAEHTQAGVSRKDD